jgi:putative ATPase
VDKDGTVGLFGSAHLDQEPVEGEPLASRLRPVKLEDFVGQRQLIGPGKFLRTAIETDHIPSMIWYGPPGCGKSTLAAIIARHTAQQFSMFSAVHSGVAEIRQAAAEAEARRTAYRQRTILFVEEIHRLNKSQQDTFLPHVEKGTFTLIGATTENPFFEIIPPLLSRCRILVFEPLADEDVRGIMIRALTDEERGLGKLGLEITPEAFEHILTCAAGDARQALNMLEVAAEALQAGLGDGKTIDLPLAIESTQRRLIRHDKSGDVHYDAVSAFIKSMRGSDPDAALYWMARLLHAGEDPRFIARRVVIHAAEDVGNADPQALVVAAAAAQAVEFVGMPEAQIPLAEAVIYVATAEKSNATVAAISAAMRDVRTRKVGTVPRHLRDSSYRGAEQLGHGTGYLYPHDYPEGQVAQQYLPDELKGASYYVPKAVGYEKILGARLAKWRKAVRERENEPRGE